MDQQVHYQAELTEGTRAGACGVVDDRLGETFFTSLVRDTTCDVCKATLGPDALNSPVPEQRHAPRRCFCGIAVKEASRLCTERDCPYR